MKRQGLLRIKGEDSFDILGEKLADIVNRGDYIKQIIPDTRNNSKGYIVLINLADKKQIKEYELLSKQ